MNKVLIPLFAAVLAAALGGCAGYDRRGLVPGASTGAQVEALMGAPAERRPSGDGGSVLYFTRGPEGRHTFVVTLGPDGVMRGIEQVLTWANIDKLVAGATTKQDVRVLFGPPGETSWLPLKERDVWEYKWLHYDDKRVLWVQFSADGIVREVINMHDFTSDPVSGRRRR